jgi:hypothetical protein
MICCLLHMSNRLNLSLRVSYSPFSHKKPFDQAVDIEQKSLSVVVSRAFSLDE